ncbi:MAG: ribonuclease Y [Candidatus Babeliaceae bacterium]|nr:ribonuclease Y [Candidatus Babeliaceae bacterium]
MVLLLLFSAGAGLCLVGLVSLFLGYRFLLTSKHTCKQAELERVTSQKEIAAERREALAHLKDELQRKRNEFKNELKREQFELERLQTKISAQRDTLVEKEREVATAKLDLQQRERELLRSGEQMQQAQEKLRHLQADLSVRLERVADMSQEEARQLLFEAFEKEVQRSHEHWLQKVEDEARVSAKERASRMLVDVMQRYAAEYVASNTSCVVQLPNDDMKGRIIGKEGRNIKVLEMSTGVDVIIDDTPSVITLSGFNPVRREVARRALEKLILDGRINPTRIEETVLAVEKEINDIVQERGKDAVLRLNLHGVAPEIISSIGQLYFRTSYSQNVLAHSIEVAHMARMLAEELGLPRPDLAARAGLFHDMGKVAATEHEGPHAQVGADIARRCGEDPIVVNAIAAHHEEVPFKTLYDPLIVIADTISASRPGARRETLVAYLKRLEKLEAIAAEFVGVKRAYALQAGREIRIIVEEDKLGDVESLQLARDVARKVEDEVNFPGQIKVHVIREKRAIEYAR